MFPSEFTQAASLAGSICAGLFALYLVIAGIRRYGHDLLSPNGLQGLGFDMFMNCLLSVVGVGLAFAFGTLATSIFAVVTLGCLPVVVNTIAGTLGGLFMVCCFQLWWDNLPMNSGVAG